MFLLVLFCFFRRRQQVNNEVNKIVNNEVNKLVHSSQFQRPERATALSPGHRPVDSWLMFFFALKGQKHCLEIGLLPLQGEITPTPCPPKALPLGWELVGLAGRCLQNEHINHGLESLLFLSSPLCRGIKGVRMKRIYNGFTTDLPFAFRLTHTPILSTSDFPPYGGGRGERPLFF